MVLKVESESYEETKPILDSNASSEVGDLETKLQEAYKNLTSSMKAGPLLIEKPIIALELFKTAVKLQNVPLARQCIDYLNKHLSKNNVLLILQHISKCKMEKSDDLEPSAPPIVEQEYECSDDWVQDLIENLKNNCFLIIDSNADFVLRQKEILELDYCDILTITTRDTLEVTREILVYSTIMRWCIEECKRRQLEIQKINLKAVLRQLTYAPRYGLMTRREFLSRTIDGVKGPDRSGILDESETERILEYMKKKGKNRTQNELPYKGDVPRKIGNEKRKIQSESSKDSNCSTKSNCDKFLINFLTCWTAIFD